MATVLGHSSIVLTSVTYGHVLEQRQRAVALGMDAVRGGEAWGCGPMGLAVPPDHP